jgi:Methyltransferase domain
MGLRTWLGLKNFQRTYGVERYSRFGRSASEVWNALLPIVGSPKSVVDFGAGSCDWLAALSKLQPGVDCIGVDHPLVPSEGIYIPHERFVRADLTEPLDLGRRFDLAVCVEVAEHLPESAANTLVETICNHSDTALFSGAIPKQGGAGHVNEQWPIYWIEKFAKYGLKCFDIVRPRIWSNTEIEYWYRQNLFVFSRTLQDKPHLTNWGGASIVHPELFTSRGNKRFF